jgi:hypothetical protein
MSNRLSYLVGSTTVSEGGSFRYRWPQPRCCRDSIGNKEKRTSRQAQGEGIRSKFQL